MCGITAILACSVLHTDTIFLGVLGSRGVSGTPGPQPVFLGTPGPQPIFRDPRTPPCISRDPRTLLLSGPFCSRDPRTPPCISRDPTSLGTPGPHLFFVGTPGPHRVLLGTPGPQPTPAGPQDPTRKNVSAAHAFSQCLRKADSFVLNPFFMK